MLLLIKGGMSVLIEFKLKEVMEEKGINGTELSKLTGIPEGRISDYKRGRYCPSIVTSCLLAKALNCKLSDLIEYE